MPVHAGGVMNCCPVITGPPDCPPCTGSPAPTDPVGIETGIAPVGCIQDDAGIIIGKVFLCKTTDEATLAVSYEQLYIGQGVAPIPYDPVVHGDWGDCEAGEISTTVSIESYCAEVDGQVIQVTPIALINSGIHSGVINVDSSGAVIAGVVTRLDPCDERCCGCS